MKDGYPEQLLEKLNYYKDRDMIPTFRHEIFSNPQTKSSSMTVTFDIKDKSQEITVEAVVKVVASDVGIAAPKRLKNRSFLFR